MFLTILFLNLKKSGVDAYEQPGFNTTCDSPYSAKACEEDHMLNFYLCRDASHDCLGDSACVDQCIKEFYENLASKRNNLNLRNYV